MEIADGGPSSGNRSWKCGWTREGCIHSGAGKRCSPVDVGSDREVLVELLERGERHFVLGVR